MDNELYHYGILGMKWGIRRYQNPDGSLTEEGKKRYGVGTKTFRQDARKKLIDAAKEHDLFDNVFFEDLSIKYENNPDKFDSIVKGDMETLAKEYGKYLDKYIDHLDDEQLAGWLLMLDNEIERLKKAKHSDTSSDELYHYGILGMKWGIRRYQNKDGTLTAAGRKRYDKAQATLDELNGAKAKSDDKAHRNMSPRQKVKEMTDEELARATDRLNKEKNYLDALAKMTPPKKKTVGDVLRESIIKEIEKLPGRVVEEGMKTFNKYMTDKKNEPIKLKEAALKAEVKLLSDDALKDAVNRAENEQKYIDIKMGRKKKEKDKN